MSTEKIYNPTDLIRLRNNILIVDGGFKATWGQGSHGTTRIDLQGYLPDYTTASPVPLFALKPKMITLKVGDGDKVTPANIPNVYDRNGGGNAKPAEISGLIGNLMVDIKNGFVDLTIALSRDTVIFKQTDKAILILTISANPIAEKQFKMLSPQGPDWYEPFDFQTNFEIRVDPNKYEVCDYNQNIQILDIYDAKLEGTVDISIPDTPKFNSKIAIAAGTPAAAPAA